MRSPQAHLAATHSSRVARDLTLCSPATRVLLCGCSDGAVGTFYEGVMTKGYSTNATDAAVQANIVRAGYGK